MHRLTVGIRLIRILHAMQESDILNGVNGVLIIKCNI